MKKRLNIILFSCFLAIFGLSSGLNAYTIQTGDTLSKIAKNANLSIDEILTLNPQITNPNLIYAGRNLNLQFLGSGGGTPITDYDETLARPITSSATTIYVSSLETTDGHTITTADIIPAIYLVLETDNPNKKEIVKCTGTNTTDVTFTGCTRGLAFYGTTETAVTANQKSHGGGTSIILSDVHYYFLSNNVANTWTAIQTFASSSDSTTQRIDFGTSTPAYFKNLNGVLYYCNNGASCAAIGAGANTYTFITPLTTSGSEVKVATSTYDFKLRDNLLAIASSTITNGTASTTAIDDHFNARWNATTTKDRLTLNNATITNATTTTLYSGQFCDSIECRSTVGSNRMLYASSTNYTNSVNTTASTTIATFTIPANYLIGNNQIVGTIPFHSDTVSGNNFYMDLLMDSTTILDIESGNNILSATGTINIILGAKNSSSAQVNDLSIQTTYGTPSEIRFRSFSSESTIDMSTSHTFTLRGRWDVSTAWFKYGNNNFSILR
jgi:LysM repeat protein